MLQRFLKDPEPLFPDYGEDCCNAFSLLQRADSVRCQGKAMIQFAVLAYERNYHLFSDGQVFNLILDIADSPTFQLFQLPMYFFEAITHFPESDLVGFVSERFIFFLLNHFFGQNTEIASQVLLIWANMLGSSELISQFLITADWIVAVLARASADFDRLYLSLMEFLTNLLKQYTILEKLQIDILSDISDIITRLFQLKSEDAISVALNGLRTIVAVADRQWVIRFFSSEMLSAVARATFSQVPGVCDDAVALLLTFSAFGEFALKKLIESGYPELSFDGAVLGNDILCSVADTAANFLSASPEIALPFLHTRMMESLITLGNDSPFDVKIRIARGFCFICHRQPDALFPYGFEWLEIMFDCTDSADSGYVILVLEAVLALLNYAEQNPGDAVAVAAQEMVCHRFMEGMSDTLSARDDLPEPVYGWIRCITNQQIPQGLQAGDN
jgi:hypothetical protein